MRVSQMVLAGPLAATMLAASVAGCSSAPPPSTAKPGSATPATTTASAGPSSSVSASPSDYTALLIKATDIDAPMPFIAGPPTNNPDGQPGAAITFSSQPHPRRSERRHDQGRPILSTPSESCRIRPLPRAR